MIYKENFKVGLKDIWKGNEVSNSAILEYLEDIAAYHSDSVGYGINTTKKFVKELVKQNITIASGLAIRNRHNSTYCHIRE